jgi:hypothetical protein
MRLFIYYYPTPYMQIISTFTSILLPYMQTISCFMSIHITKGWICMDMKDEMIYLWRLINICSWRWGWALNVLNPCFVWWGVHMLCFDTIVYSWGVHRTFDYLQFLAWLVCAIFIYVFTFRVPRELNPNKIKTCILGVGHDPFVRYIESWFLYTHFLYLL